MAAPEQAEAPLGDMSEADRLRKTTDTLRARLALAGGYTLHELSDGTYLVSRWDRTRHCASLQEVRIVTDLMAGATS